jgi:hypothetical protein
MIHLRPDRRGGALMVSLVAAGLIALAILGTATYLSWMLRVSAGGARISVIPSPVSERHLYYVSVCHVLPSSRTVVTITGPTQPDGAEFFLLKEYASQKDGCLSFTQTSGKTPGLYQMRIQQDISGRLVDQGLTTFKVE